MDVKPLIQKDVDEAVAELITLSFEFWLGGPPRRVLPQGKQRLPEDPKDFRAERLVKGASKMSRMFADDLNSVVETLGKVRARRRAHQERAEAFWIGHYAIEHLGDLHKQAMTHTRLHRDVPEDLRAKIRHAIETKIPPLANWPNRKADLAAALAKAVVTPQKSTRKKGDDFPKQVFTVIRDHMTTPLSNNTLYNDWNNVTENGKARPSVLKTVAEVEAGLSFGDEDNIHERFCHLCRRLGTLDDSDVAVVPPSAVAFAFANRTLGPFEVGDEEMKLLKDAWLAATASARRRKADAANATTPTEVAPAGNPSGVNAEDEPAV